MEFLWCVVGVIIALVAVGVVELVLGFVATNFGGVIAIALGILLLGGLWYLRIRR